MVNRKLVYQGQRGRVYWVVVECQVIKWMDGSCAPGWAVIASFTDQRDALDCVMGVES